MNDRITRDVLAHGPIASGPLTRLPVPRPVDRFRYVRERCQGKRVLDLGAYDETVIGRPQHRSWRWLHAEIADVAKETLGVDASAALKAQGGVDTECGTRIVYGDVNQLEAIIEDFGPDLVVAGELIEHTPNTRDWLAKLATTAPGTRILMTTPNTTYNVNLILALLNREGCHPDHMQIYSFRTLVNMVREVPMHGVTIHPYYSVPYMFTDKLPRWASSLVTAVNTLFLKPTQFLFPMMACGWIVEGVLGPRRHPDTPAQAGDGRALSGAGATP